MTKNWLTAATALFAQQLAREVAFSADRLKEVYSENHESVGVPDHIGPREFIEELLTSGVLTKTEIKAAQRNLRDARPSYRPYLRYIKPTATAVEVAISLRPHSYLSHRTAAHLHQLLTNSDVIYVNKEQAPKPPPAAKLTQESIDRAFSYPPRVSHFVYRFAEVTIVLLSGKHTADFEVIERNDVPGMPVRLTSLERTLVDMAVRPSYAGGVSQVLAAFRAARPRISVPKLVGVLKTLNHAYPYHQAVGFYLQKAGHPPEELKGLKDLGLHFDFYLANNAKSALDKDWRVFVPVDIQGQR